MQTEASLVYGDHICDAYCCLWDKGVESRSGEFGIGLISL
jgi:hypothetical protein